MDRAGSDKCQAREWTEISLERQIVDRRMDRVQK